MPPTNAHVHVPQNKDMYAVMPLSKVKNSGGIMVRQFVMVECGYSIITQIKFTKLSSIKPAL